MSSRSSKATAPPPAGKERARPEAGTRAAVPSPDAEWLETDGLGGFASGTVAGIRTRRYHGLLLAATTPPTGRVMLVNGLEAFVVTPAGRFALSAERFAPDVIHPDGAGRIESFTADPSPRWRYALEDGTRVERELVVLPGAPRTLVIFRLLEPRQDVRLVVRPFLSGRDFHALHHENDAFAFEPERQGDELIWHPYPGIPSIALKTNGRYEHRPEWYRGFLYSEERARGLDDREDLASPGSLTFDLSAGQALLWFAAGTVPGRSGFEPGTTLRDAAPLVEKERRRRASLPGRLERAAEAYIVRRGEGLTIAAGYPWFADWGRDTFIALRGFCLATGRLDEARDILVTWAGSVSEGMLPNRFPDRGGTPEYNSVDASLWYIVAVSEYLAAARPAGRDRDRLRRAVAEILDGYARGTRYGIRLDDDGLLASGTPGVPLTWMDARAGDWVVTPRIGKPVEVQALWCNALSVGAGLAPRYRALLEKATASFRARFWNEARGALHDVVDVDHERGRVDPTFRPNQILAVGGLPLALLEGERARSVVDAVEASLLTPVGLRSLAPDELGYRPRYAGGLLERDGAYHQGTVWPWLLGPFVEAWVRVRGGTPEVKREARARFLAPLLLHLDEAGLGHVSEIADAEPPFAPRGCPFQAWSVGEALRLDRLVLDAAPSAIPPPARSRARGAAEARARRRRHTAPPAPPARHRGRG